MIYELTEKIDLPADVANAWDMLMFLGVIAFVTAATVALGMHLFMRIEGWLVNRIGAVGACLVFLFWLYGLIMPAILWEWSLIIGFFGG